jgi:hypothetical protein
MKYEYDIYKSIEKHRREKGHPDISNYKDIKMAFTNLGRYYIGYDG